MLNRFGIGVNYITPTYVQCRWSQNGHVEQKALLLYGINTSGTTAIRFEKRSNLLLSWNQWGKLRCRSAPPSECFSQQLLPLICFHLPLSHSLSLTLYVLSPSSSCLSPQSMLNRICCARRLCCSLSDLSDVSLVLFLPLQSYSLKRKKKKNNKTNKQ